MRQFPQLPFLSLFIFSFFSILLAQIPRGIAHISILSIFIANGAFYLMSTHQPRPPKYMHTYFIRMSACVCLCMGVYDAVNVKIEYFYVVFITILFSAGTALVVLVAALYCCCSRCFY